MLLNFIFYSAFNNEYCLKAIFFILFISVYPNLSLMPRGLRRLWQGKARLDDMRKKPCEEPDSKGNLSSFV